MNTTLNINYDPLAPGQFALTFSVNGTTPNLSTGYTARIYVWRSGLPTTASPDYTGTEAAAIALGTSGSIILDLVVIHAALAAVSSTCAVWTYDLVVIPSAGYAQKVCSGQLAEGVGADDDVDVTAPISVTWAGIAGGDLSGNFPNPLVDGLQGRPVASTAPAAAEVLTWNGSAWAPAPGGGGGGTVSMSGDVQGTSAASVVHKVHGYDMQSGAPADNDVWSYQASGSNWHHRSLSQAGIAAASHVHAAADVTSGTLDIARIPTGTSATTVAIGNHTHALSSLTQSGALTGEVVTWNGSAWAAAGIPTTASTVVINEYTYDASGTYTKAVDCKFIYVEGCGGGGNGASGSASAGGNGGCGATYFNLTIPVSLITTSTLTVTIGAGGNPGGDSELQLSGGGAVLVRWPGGRANSNEPRNVLGGTLTNAYGAGGVAASSTSGRVGGWGPGGGGAGSATINTAGTAGGSAGLSTFTSNLASQGGGAAGGATGGNGVAGSAAASANDRRGFGEGGGGGGGGSTPTTGNGGNGGNGRRGSGGGGGGAGQGTAGTGGTGGSGFIRIIEVCYT